jgi:hypothetical protein
VVSSAAYCSRDLHVLLPAPLVLTNLYGVSESRLSRGELNGKRGSSFGACLVSRSRHCVLCSGNKRKQLRGDSITRIAVEFRTAACSLWQGIIHCRCAGPCKGGEGVTILERTDLGSTWHPQRRPAALYRLETSHTNCTKLNVAVCSAQ